MYVFCSIKFDLELYVWEIESFLQTLWPLVFSVFYSQKNYSRESLVIIIVIRNFIDIYRLSVLDEKLFNINLVWFQIFHLINKLLIFQSHASHLLTKVFL